MAPDRPRVTPERPVDSRPPTDKGPVPSRGSPAAKSVLGSPARRESDARVSGTPDSQDVPRADASQRTDIAGVLLPRSNRLLRARLSAQRETTRASRELTDGAASPPARSAAPRQGWMAGTAGSQRHDRSSRVGHSPAPGPILTAEKRFGPFAELRPTPRISRRSG